MMPECTSYSLRRIAELSQRYQKPSVVGYEGNLQRRSKAKWSDFAPGERSMGKATAGHLIRARSADKGLAM